MTLILEPYEQSEKKTSLKDMSEYGECLPV